MHHSEDGIAWYSLAILIGIYIAAIILGCLFIQTKIQIRPFVIVEFEGNGFALRKIGIAPALNVGVRDVVIDCRNKAVSYVQGKPAADFFAAHLDPDYAVYALEMIVSYQNVEGKDYTVPHAIGPSSARILGLHHHIV